MSASKFAAKPTIVKASAAKAPAAKRPATKVEVAQDKPFVDPVVDEAMRSYAASQDELLSALKVPSGTRLLCAGVVGLLTYASSIWFAVPLIEWLTIAALALTGSAFLAYLVYVLGVFAVIIASMISGWKAGAFVLEVDVDKLADTGRTLRDNIKKRGRLVAGWFKREPRLDDCVDAGING